MAKIKVALAQIDYKPAFFYNQFDMLIEPYGDESTTISSFSFSGSLKLKKNLRENYISWIKLKILTILKKAMSIGINILVFPEYSIPVEILDDMVNAIKYNNIILVAGTHIITKTKCKLPNGYPDSNKNLGCAICPILTSDGIVEYTLKTHKARPEINSIKVPKGYVKDVFDIGNIKIQIKICIDAITGGSSLSFNKENKGILIIPSLSKNVEPFQALAILSNFNEIPVIYANCSSGGGSIISGAFSKYSEHWFAEKTTTKPVPKNIECIVTATIDLDQMHNAIGTVHTVEAISIEEVVNIFYRKEESHKATVDSICSYLNNFDICSLSGINNQCSDSILAQKIRYLNQTYENGLLDKNLAERTLDHIMVNSTSLKQLMYEQSKKALNTIAANMSQGIFEEKLYDNIAKLSERIASADQTELQSTNLLDDDRLFSGRDDEISGLSQFFNSDNNVYLLHGLRGIGKTKLVNKISTKVLPSPSPWEIKFIELEKGVGYELLFDQVSYSLNLPYIEQKDMTPESIVNRIFEIIEQRAPIALIFDDIHNCTEVNGLFSDIKIKEFILNFIKHSQLSKKLKLILTSNRRIADIAILGIEPTEISRLNDADVRFVISYCYRKITSSTKTFEIADSIINIIYGNPLAAILVAQLIDEDKLQEFESKGAMFQRFQERLIKNLLGEVSLSEDETMLMNLLSATKTPVEVDFIQKKYTHLLPAVDSLTNRFLVEKTNMYIKVHPLFKEYYYDLLSIKERADYHKVFASYYDELYSDAQRMKKKQTNPTILSNVIFHYAGSLEIDKVKQYKAKYIEELKPIADRLFRDKNYEEAVRYYSMIYNTVGIQRTDVFIKMAQCYVYCSDIYNAEKFFKLAISANPRGAYLWAKYAIALASKKKYLSMANEYANQAENIYNKFKNDFHWELASIKFAQARACRFENIEKALKLYDEACSLEPTSPYYLCMYARYLYDNGNKEKAFEKYNIAKNIDPDYDFLKRLNAKFEEQATYSEKELSIEDEDFESEE